MVENAYNRKRASKIADEILAAEEGGDEVFAEVSWPDVKPVRKVPLDEDGLFLERGIHWMSADPGSGKTILAYWKCVRRAKRRQHSAIYECEMGEERALGLLRNLGATDRDLDYIHYYKAKEDEDGVSYTVIDLVRHGRAFCRMLISSGYGEYLVYDAVAPLLVAAGKNENEASDVRAWATASCRPIAMAGGAVGVIDHTGHANGGRSRGSSDKPAAGDIILTLEKTAPFARGISGAITLKVTKDRSGTLLDGAELAIEVKASADGSLDLEPDEWDSSISDAKPSVGGRIGPEQVKIRAEIERVNRSGRETVSVPELADELDMDEEKIRSALRRGAKRKKPIFAHVEHGKWRTVGETGRVRSGRKRSPDRSPDETGRVGSGS
jgi:hypothetical protein